MCHGHPPRRKANGNLRKLSPVGPQYPAGLCRDLDRLRLTIRGVAIHEKGDARWAQLPAKPQVKDGALVKDPGTGKIQYTPIMDFDGRAVRDAFSAAVINAVLERAPEAFALDGEAPS